MSKPVVELSWNQLMSVPSKQFYLRYEDQFDFGQQARKDPKSLHSDQMAAKRPIQMKNLHDMEYLKYSLDPETRTEYFRAYCNASKEANLPIILELCKLRRDYAASMSNDSTFFSLQSRRNLIHIQGSLKDKIALMRQHIRSKGEADLETIKELTGLQSVRYYDMSFIREKLKATMLSQEKNNIHMLTCFSVTNVLNGLLLALRELFGRDFTCRTIILDGKTAEQVEVFEGSRAYPFVVEAVADKRFQDCIVVFEVKIEERGTIIFDLF